MASDKYYTLPISPDCRRDCSYCGALGFRKGSHPSRQDQEKSLAKATHADYRAMLLPCNGLEVLGSESLANMSENFRTRGVGTILTIHWKDFDLSKLPSTEIGLQLLIDSSIDWSEALWEQFDSLDHKKYITLVVTRECKLDELVFNLPKKIRDEIHLYFPLKLNSSDKFYETDEIAAEIDRLHLYLPEFIVRPPKGHEVYEPRIDPGAELELNGTAETLFSADERPSEVSVVIPVYNNKKYLLNTLRHLFQQNTQRAFEIVIVDDGSTDGLKDDLFPFVQNRQLQNCSVKYVHYPRTHARKMGDGLYRAGLARNLGVKNAQGSILIFLDSDILTPSNLIEKTVELHRENDVIQYKRYQLKKSSSSGLTDYREVSHKNDTYIPLGGYWEKFQETADWHSMKDGWKYVSTFGLSLKRSLFREMGWFKKTYIFYGFEDTDLGYTLHKAGKKRHLANLNVYHLYHENERSEFRNSQFRKRMILARTAKIFYHNNLQPEVFWLFRRILGSHLVFRLVTREFLANESVGFGPRWRRLVSFIQSNLWRSVLNEFFGIFLLTMKTLLGRPLGLFLRRFFLKKDGTVVGPIEFFWNLHWGLWKIAFLVWPLRKIYYMAEYQWTQRLKPAIADKRPTEKKAL